MHIVIHHLSARTSAGVHSESGFKYKSLRCLGVKPAANRCFSSSGIVVLTQPEVLSTPPAYFRRTYIQTRVNQEIYLHHQRHSYRPVVKIPKLFRRRLEISHPIDLLALQYPIHSRRFCLCLLSVKTIYCDLL